MDPGTRRPLFLQALRLVLTTQACAPWLRSIHADVPLARCNSPRACVGVLEDVDANKPVSGTLRALCWAGHEVDQRRQPGRTLVCLIDMRYNVYLAAGCPIATGVIEGAGRHVV